MKGAALFLFTVMMVAPSNRTAVQEYVDQTTARLAAESPFPQVVLVSTGLIALMLMFILRDQTPARQTRFIVHREIRGLAGDEAGTRVHERGHFRNTGRLSRIMRVLWNCVGTVYDRGPASAPTKAKLGQRLARETRYPGATATKKIAKHASSRCS